jgi:ComF family protein
MAILDLVLPPACAGCGAFGTLLCDRCRSAFRPPSDPLDRFVASDAGIVIGEHLELAVAAFAYAGEIRSVLGRVKYAGAARVSEGLATAAAPALRRVLSVSGPATLVPVPLHPARQRERGFNQASLLADAFARLTGLPRADLLGRDRATLRQHGLDRASRVRNLAGAFRAVAGSETPPHAVIVVDDILTTSATMESCAAVLRAAGTERVYGFAVAREV